MAHLITIKELGDVVLFDIDEGVAKGKALDIAQSTSVSGSDINLIGTSNYEDIKNLHNISYTNLEGVIAGKSYYSGTIKIDKALKILTSNA